jgi:hypothetical protein
VVASLVGASNIEGGGKPPLETTWATPISYPQQGILALITIEGLLALPATKVAGSAWSAIKPYLYYTRPL